MQELGVTYVRFAQTNIRATVNVVGYLHRGLNANIFAQAAAARRQSRAYAGSVKQRWYTDVCQGARWGLLINPISQSLDLGAGTGAGAARFGAPTQLLWRFDSQAHQARLDHMTQEAALLCGDMCEQGVAGVLADVAFWVAAIPLYGVGCFAGLLIGGLGWSLYAAGHGLAKLARRHPQARVSLSQTIVALSLVGGVTTAVVAGTLAALPGYVALNTARLPSAAAKAACVAIGAAVAAVVGLRHVRGQTAAPFAPAAAPAY